MTDTSTLRAQSTRCGDEERRILEAARDGRMYTNEHGRWLIAGGCRPDRKTREKLRARGLIDWTWSDDEPKFGMKITDAGRAALEGSSDA